LLFGYPATATKENWFHDCLYDMLQTIHTGKQQGQPTPVWPEIIPEAHRTTLSRRHGLRDRLNAYREVVKTLNESELSQVINALNEQNDMGVTKMSWKIDISLLKTPHNSLC
jgi:hypothetical protein